MLYVTGISGSNDTTGKDCVRYGFRQNFYGETAANAIGPVLVKAYGKDKKAAFMTPDYTYGHTVTKSVNDYLTKNGGWTQVTNQVSPLGTQDFSQYLTNIANSGADVIVNVNWGRDAVLSVQQAKQFGLTPKMQMVIPYQIPFLAKETGPELTEGVYAATDFWWTLEDKYPLAKMFVEAFDKKYGYKPEWGANNAYMSVRHLGAHGVGGGHLLSAGRHQAVREGREVRLDRRRSATSARRITSWSVRWSSSSGKAPKADEEQGGLLGGPRGRAGRAADAEARRVRLQARRIHLRQVTIPSPHKCAEKVPRFKGSGNDLPRRYDVQPCPRIWDGEAAPDPSADGSVINWANFISQCFNGLVLGALLALISSGLTIIYGTLGVLNLAHGAMFMLGGYAGWVAYSYTGSFIVAVIAGSLFVMMVGMVMERGSSATSTAARTRTSCWSRSGSASFSSRRCAFSSAACRKQCRLRLSWPGSRRSASCSIRHTASRCSA